MVGDTGITNSSDIEMSNAHNNNEVDDINTESNIDSDDEGNNNVSNPIMDLKYERKEQDNMGSDDKNNNDDDEVGYPLLGIDAIEELTWIRIGRAIDRICRVAIPIAFSVGSIKLVADSQ
jgi:hypothetical protein